MLENIQLTLSPDRVAVGPGERAEVVADIRNAGTIVDVFFVEVQGVGSDWYNLSVSTVSLFPGDKETVRIGLSPPPTTATKAGAYTISVKVRSSKDPAVVSTATFTLDVRQVSSYDLELSPKKLRARRGRFRATITNDGNAASTYKLQGSDPEEKCNFKFRSDTVLVEPGRKAEVPLAVSPKRKPFTGAAKSFDFTVTATPLGGEAKASTTQGHLDCPALVPKWALAAAVVGVAIIIAVVVVLSLLGGGGEGLPINDSFTLGPGGHREFGFDPDSAGNLQVGVTWSGASREMALILRDADGIERDRQMGASPLDINHALSEQDAAGGGRWVVYVANLAPNQSADVDLTVELK